MSNISSTDSNTIPAKLASVTRRVTRREWGRRFPEQPDTDVSERLAEFSPREMRRVMFNAFGNAKLAGRDEVEEADIAESREKQKQRIGF